MLCVIDVACSCVYKYIQYPPSAPCVSGPSCVVPIPESMHIYVSIQLVSVLVLYCMLKGSYWGPDWRIETDKSRAMPVLFHSYIQLHTHITAAGQQACPCYYWWWMCVISSIPLMHQEALTCLCQTWLATGFMGFIWLWSADEAVFVCVWESKYTFDQPNQKPAADSSLLWTRWCSRNKNLLWCKQKSLQTVNQFVP